MAAKVPSLIIRDDLGITPEVQSKLDHAAELCRQALARVEDAFQAAEDGTDAERRCRDTIGELEGVLYQLEWAPPKEMQS
jgi:hypothetical protein